ncbi:MAG: non-homologous end-joining DNA ligase [Gammaproteobacteria bacterium]|nr:non-homologous end-joining DNA ligase [Gammaproteobacteria bacterium]MDE2347426.1 non-homologous end-joining DNA ligase [Gammaproteobacteria bacterium]
MNRECWRVGAQTIELTHLDKVLFPGAQPFTKRDLAEYYRRIAPTMLPYLAARPLTMQRFPDGIDQEGFYQKEIPAHFPAWIGRVSLPKAGGRVTQVVCEDAATLVYLAEQACITPHVGLSRVDQPQNPDRMIFDLDPPHEEFEPVRAAAMLVRVLLQDLGLASHLMTTGSRGLHVVVPLDRATEFDTVRAFARAAAAVLARRHSPALSIDARIVKRRGRLYLDTTRNAYGQTGVAPYALRARPGAPVATPLAWEELDEPGLDARRYRLDNLFARLERDGDPWRHIAQHAQSLAAPLARLADLTRDEGGP